jgi:hypothetical protein
LSSKGRPPDRVTGFAAKERPVRMTRIVHGEATRFQAIVSSRNRASRCSPTSGSDEVAMFVLVEILDAVALFRSRCCKTDRKAPHMRGFSVAGL